MELDTLFIIPNWDIYCKSGTMKIDDGKNVTIAE